MVTSVLILAYFFEITCPSTFFACTRISVQIQLMKKDASGNLPKVVLMMGLES